MVKINKVAWLIIGGLTILSYTSHAQTIPFYEIYIEPSVAYSGKYKNIEVFDLGTLQLLKKKKKANEISVVDPSNQEIIFTFQNDERGTHFTSPKFFKSDVDSLPIILTVDIHFEHSLGHHIFFIKEKEVIHNGFIEFAADDFNFSSLSLYSQYEMQGDKIIQTIQDIDIIDLANEEIIKGSTLKFEIQERTIRRVWN